MQQGSSTHDGIRRSVLRQASFAASVMGFPRPTDAEMESILNGEELPESLRRGARRLFREENANILQDLVAGGACSYTQMLACTREYSPDEIDLIAWMTPLASLEEGERTTSAAFTPKD